mmetsp:Transcript_109/g.260  ORF Transcript_109/g.260 Transcript_109/m.260 type:complete len:286 (-) Transcript_109:363-1220(-)
MIRAPALVMSQKQRLPPTITPTLMPHSVGPIFGSRSTHAPMSCTVSSTYKSAEIVRRCKRAPRMVPKGAPKGTTGAHTENKRHARGAMGPPAVMAPDVSRVMNPTTVFPAMRTTDVGVAVRSVTRNKSVSMAKLQMSRPLPEMALFKPPKTPVRKRASAGPSWSPLGSGVGTRARRMRHTCGPCLTCGGGAVSSSPTMTTTMPSSRTSLSTRVPDVTKVGFGPPPHWYVGTFRYVVRSWFRLRSKRLEAKANHTETNTSFFVTGSIMGATYINPTTMPKTPPTDA